jgi:hypothetical protein
VCGLVVIDVDSQSHYGRQPFRALLIEQGRTIAGASRALGFDSGYGQRVALGRVAPSDQFRQAISEMLARPVSELFTNDALASTYMQPGNARGLRHTVGGEIK